LAPDDEGLAKEKLTRWISDFLADVGARQVLTKSDRVVVENVLFEMILNAHRHEGIRMFQISSKLRTITIEYGSVTGYGLTALMSESEGWGGADAVHMLEGETQGRISLNYQFSGKKSRWICSAAQLGYSDDPCAINLRGSTDKELEIFKSKCEGCTQVHVHGHLDDHSSDNWVTARYVKELVDEGYQVVVHSMPGPMARHLKKTILDVLGGRGNFEISEHA
jgi:hypothetical protein